MSLIVFGILAAFSVQGMEAVPMDARTVELRELSDLVDEAKSHIASLHAIASLFRKILERFIALNNAIKEKFLNKGVGDISVAFKKGIDFIASKIEEATNQGADIGQCISGKHEQLIELATGLAGELTVCVSEPVSAANTEINTHLLGLDGLVAVFDRLPGVLDECLTSSEPDACVTNMNLDMTDYERQTKTYDSRVVGQLTISYANISGPLGSCSAGIPGTANSKVDAMTDEVSKCIDELNSQTTFRL